MRLAIYPGSFDPVTHGHLDVLQRAPKLFDEVVIAVALNDQKIGLFSTDERVAMLQRSSRPLPNVRVAALQRAADGVRPGDRGHGGGARPARGLGLRV